MYIDSHAHLSDEAYDEDIDQVLDRLVEYQIEKVNLIGMDSSSLSISLDMLERHPGQFDVSCGLHPADIQNYSDEEKEEMFSYFSDERIICIGEIGLDYHWYPEHKELQKEWFIKQIEAANAVKKPIMIHCRDAIEDTFNILKEHRPKYGCVMHSYSGSVEMMHEFIKIGCTISLGGPVTFKNAKTPKEVAKEVPLDKLLTETDSPYLTPMPFRGKRNESSYVRFVVKEIASLKGISEEELTNAVIENYNKLFHKEDKN